MFWLVLAACSPVWQPDPPVDHAFVVFDPEAGILPTPNDLAYDPETRRLALPLDTPGLSAAERAWREVLGAQDGFSTVSPISVPCSHPIDARTVDSGAVQVWRLGPDPAPVAGLDWGLSSADTLEIRPPAEGWQHGRAYAVLVRGGPGGVRTVGGQPLGADAAFALLRAGEPLTDHPHALPGGSRAEREAAAADLEEARQRLLPALELADRVGVPRAELAAAFPFRITRRPELAMDVDSQRMPLPFDLLVDPRTGFVDLPPSPSDDALEADAKLVANTLRGFSVSASLQFEATAPLHAATVSRDTVALWDLDAPGGPAPVPATVRAYKELGPCEPDDGDCRYVLVDPGPLPLEPGRTYAVVVREGITAADGEPLLAMPIGQLLALPHPLGTATGQSTVSSVPATDAARLEGVRLALQGLLAARGTADLVAAWPFTTMDPAADRRADVQAAARFDVEGRPTVTERGPPARLFGEDPLSDLFPGPLNPAEPLYRPRVDGVAEVVQGTLVSPQFLDPITRRGDWEAEPRPTPIAFMATRPAGVPADEPLPVVIFGHAITTDRRFVLTVAGALAARGFAAVAIDLPYHGERTACIDASLVAVPNFFPEDLRATVGFTDDLVYLPPCASGSRATCAPTGECLGPDGQPEDFNRFPVVDLLPASGAAFLDVHDLPHIPDHFRQALVDLGALRHSLQTDDWASVLGQPLQRDRFAYLGQSLGGILGSVYVISDPFVSRAVLNVPGANVVDLFVDSTFFGPQMEAFYDDLGLVEGTWEHRRLLDVARWLMDSVDPHTVAHRYRTAPVEALIQIAKIDERTGDFVIPNHTTELLAARSGLEMVAYPSVLHGDLVIPLIGDEMLEDAADFLAAEPL